MIDIGSSQLDDIFEQCSKAVLPGHALLLAMHIINHTTDAEMKDEKVISHHYIATISTEYSIVLYVHTYVRSYVH